MSADQVRLGMPAPFSGPNGASVNRNMFHACASYTDGAASIVDQLVPLGIRSLAVFYQDDGIGLSEKTGRDLTREKPVAMLKGLREYDLGTIAMIAAPPGIAVRAS
ncbi:MAG TPA: hypothetical protein VIG66_01295 [Noviherbaspirillum sp.]